MKPFTKSEIIISVQRVKTKKKKNSYLNEKINLYFELCGIEFAIVINGGKIMSAH